METSNPVERREILEERANRDARNIAFALIVLLGLGIVVLGIAAWNSRFMLMPIVPREQLPPVRQSSEHRIAGSGQRRLAWSARFSLPATRSFFLLAPRMKSPAGDWVSGNVVLGYACTSAARLGVGAPRLLPKFGGRCVTTSAAHGALAGRRGANLKATPA